MTVHFLNLSRGLLCAPATRGTIHYSRIQSTSCEQKRWGDVIIGAGADLLMHMALGHDIIVHDHSERPRETRAMWQGLAFVRRACETIWGLELTPIPGRGGLAMQQYFDHELHHLDPHARKLVKHYRKHLATEVIRVQSCWGLPHTIAASARKVAA